MNINVGDRVWYFDGESLVSDLIAVKCDCFLVTRGGDKLDIYSAYLSRDACIAGMKRFLAMLEED